MDSDSLTPGTFEVHGVRLEVAWQSAVVACTLIGSACIAGFCVVFTVLSLSAGFGGIIVHLAVCACVLPTSVSSSATAKLSARGVLSRTSVCISDFFG